MSTQNVYVTRFARNVYATFSMISIQCETDKVLKYFGTILSLLGYIKFQFSRSIFLPFEFEQLVLSKLRNVVQLNAKQRRRCVNYCQPHF